MICMLVIDTVIVERAITPDLYTLAVEDVLKNLNIT